MALGGLLALEAVGGLVIFFVRLAFGSVPGEALHVWGGIALTAVYALYQWRHWSRVAPMRARLDYVLGLLAAFSMALANLTGLALGLAWWHERFELASRGAVSYPAGLSGLHNIGSMMVLAFVCAHLGAVLLRDRRAGRT